MAIRLYRAYSPGTRSRSSLFFDEITVTTPQKSLTFGKKACSGRNNRGVITLGNRGGGYITFVYIYVYIKWSEVVRSGHKNHGSD